MRQAFSTPLHNESRLRHSYYKPLILCRRVSLVANHTCQSLKMLPCDEGPTVSQFTFTCTADNMWDTAILGTAAFSVRPDPLATLSTSLRTDCFQCVHPDQTSRPDVDQITHCIRKQQRKILLDKINAYTFVIIKSVLTELQHSIL